MCESVYSIWWRCQRWCSYVIFRLLYRYTNNFLSEFHYTGCHISVNKSRSQSKTRWFLLGPGIYMWEMVEFLSECIWSFWASVVVQMDVLSIFLGRLLIGVLCIWAMCIQFAILIHWCSLYRPTQFAVSLDELLVVLKSLLPLLGSSGQRLEVFLTKSPLYYIKVTVREDRLVPFRYDQREGYCHDVCSLIRKLVKYFPDQTFQAVKEYAENIMLNRFYKL